LDSQNNASSPGGFPDASQARSALIERSGPKSGFSLDPLNPGTLLNLIMGLVLSYQTALPVLR
jgi:hypothetical protein